MYTVRQITHMPPGALQSVQHTIWTSTKSPDALLKDQGKAEV